MESFILSLQEEEIKASVLITWTMPFCCFHSCCFVTYVLETRCSLPLSAPKMKTERLWKEVITINHLNVRWRGSGELARLYLPTLNLCDPFVSFLPKMRGCGWEAPVLWFLKQFREKDFTKERRESIGSHINYYVMLSSVKYKWLCGKTFGKMSASQSLKPLTHYLIKRT